MEMSDSAQAQAPKLTAPPPSLLSVLRVRDFRLVWTGESISLLGDQFYMVALPWLTLQLTGSGLALGAVAATAGIPRAIFMLLGGALTDRFSPRSVMFVSNTMRVVLAGLVAILVLTHTIQLWMLFVAALLFGLVDAFFFPASSAVVPMIVDADHIPSGNALMQITAQLSGFVGPALAGIVIAQLTGVKDLQALEATGGAVDTAGIGVAIGFDALTFLIAAVLLWLMRGGRTAAAQSGEPQNVLGAIGEGLRLVWRDPILRTMVVLTAAINLFFTGPMGVGIPVLANRLPEGAAAFGYILSAFGGGALVGAILAGTLPPPKRLGIVVMSLIGIAGIGLGLFGLVNHVLVAVLVAAGMGMAIGFTNVSSISWLQKRIPPEKMGRVMSLVMLGSFGLGPISNFLAGLLVDHHLMLMFSGAGLMLLLVALFSLSNRAVRAMEN
ncbi:MAG: MFS transporter [Chloroflexi bacterium]|nr:MFS transporter [Chloroflexota bacterium]MCC6894628.1 MFS transporter [Anaerolineae bacterium]